MNGRISPQSKIAIRNAPSQPWILWRSGWLFFLMIWMVVGCYRAHLSRDYGVRNHEIMERQTANPNAPSDKSGPVGLPGAVGEIVNKRHADSFKQPAAATGSSVKSEKTQ